MVSRYSCHSLAHQQQSTAGTEIDCLIDPRFSFPDDLRDPSRVRTLINDIATIRFAKITAGLQSFSSDTTSVKVSLFATVHTACCRWGCIVGIIRLLSS